LVIDQGAGFGFDDVGKLLAADIARGGAMPPIRLASIRVDSCDDDLLPVAQEFQLLTRIAVWRDQGDGDLLEGRIGGEWDSAFRGSAEAHRNVAPFVKTVAEEFFYSGGGERVENIDIDGRGVDG
jgi:hypothetical protein